MGGTNTRMRESVQGVEYSATPRLWYKGSLSASRSVTVERVSRVSKWDSFYDESGCL